MDAEHRIDDRREGGSIGIGAMIVFIALILVAAVASTIIIKTAEELQQNAENTSSDTREQISGKVSVMDVFVATSGDELGANGDTHIATMDLFVRIASGSIGVQDGDVDYFISCRLTSDLDGDGTVDHADENDDGDEADVDQVATESGTLDMVELDGTVIATGDDLDAGVSYKATITLASSNVDDAATSADEIDAEDLDEATLPGCAATAIAGSTMEMRIIVDGGGETLTSLSIDSVTLGTSVM